MPPKLPTVVITLVRRDGQSPCPCGHLVGQKWICNGPLTPEGLCANTYNSLYPTIWMLQNGVDMGSGKNGSASIQLSCQDARVRNVFEVRRLAPGEKP